MDNTDADERRMVAAVKNTLIAADVAGSAVPRSARPTRLGGNRSVVRWETSRRPALCARLLTCVWVATSHGCSRSPFGTQPRG